MFSFVDISGDLSEKSDAFVVATAATIAKAKISDFTKCMHELKKKWLNNETLEIKASDFINKNTLNHPESNKHQFIQKFIPQCLHFFEFSAIIMKNIPTEKNFDGDKLPYHYILLMQRVNAIAKKKKKHALMVIDNQARHIDARTAHAFNNYLFRSSGGADLECITEMALFADSSMTPGIQVADIAAGIIRHYHNHRLMSQTPCSDFETNVKKFYEEIIRPRSGKYRHFDGLYVTPDNFIASNFEKAPS